MSPFWGLVGILLIAVGAAGLVVALVSAGLWFAFKRDDDER